MSSPMRRLVLAYSVRNRQAKLQTILRFMAAHQLATVIVVGVAGESDEPNEDIIEVALMTRTGVVAAVSHVLVQTPLPLVVADGRSLPFRSRSVDLVLSNAVVEHVGAALDQQRFVDEHERVGKAWCITTPNRWFPVESHTSAVLIHWLPWWRSRHREQFTRLLSRREFKALLPPGAQVSGRPWSATFVATGLSRPS